MAQAPLNTTVRYLRRLTDVLGAGERSDEQLLGDFLRDRDEPAFAALVRRYATLVTGVCRRTLRHHQDAEDAFQATFLVLAQSAGSIRRSESLAAWLYGVAHRVAMNAKRSQARRRPKEQQTARTLAVLPSDELSWREVQAVLDEEVQRLPEIYRRVFVECCLHEQSKPEAARRLGLKLGTVSSRLAKAKRLLQARLSRRGVTLSALLAATGVASEGVPVSAATIEATTCAAAQFAAGVSLGGVVSVQVVALAKGITRAMLLTRAKSVTALVLLMTLLATGSGLMLASVTARPQPGPQVAKEMPAPPVDSPAEAKLAFTYRGRVLDADGKPAVGAKVYLDDQRFGERSLKERAVTDADGRFAFTVQRQEFDVSVVAEPWKRANVVAAAPGRGPTWVWAGRPADAADLTVWLASDIPVRGRVVDLQGKPVPGVTVSVGWMRYATGEGGRPIPYDSPPEQHRGGGEADVSPLLPKIVTDQDGRFEIRGLGRDRHFSMAFSGSTIERRAATLVTRPEKPQQVPGFGPYDPLRPAPKKLQYGTEFVHVAAPARPIVGVVRDAETGRPIAEVSVGKPYLRDDEVAAWTKTDRDGRYELLGLPPAEVHELQVNPPHNTAYFPTAVRARADKAVLTPLTFDIALSPQPAVRGRVVERAAGKPVKGSVEYRPLADNPHRKNLPRQAPTPWPSGPVLSTRPDAEGRFTLPVIPGKGVLLFKATDAHLAARLDPADSGKGTLDGNDPELLNTTPLPTWPGHWHAYHLLDVAADAKTVDGDLTVDAGKTVPLKVIDPDGQPCSAYVFGLAPPDPGRFTELLADGTGTVRALAAGEQRRVYARSMDKRFIGFVALGGDESGTVTLKLQPPGGVTGRLLDAQGKPLVGVRFQVAYNDGPGRPGVLFLDGFAARLLTEAEQKRERRVRGLSDSDKGEMQTGNEATDEQGRFRISGLIPGLPFDLKAQLTRPSDDPKNPNARFVVGMAKLARPTVKPDETSDLGELRVTGPR